MKRDAANLREEIFVLFKRSNCPLIGHMGQAIIRKAKRPKKTPKGRGREGEREREKESNEIKKK